MKRMTARSIAIGTALLLGAEVPRAEPDKLISPTNKDEVGKITYSTYCALCQGIDGAPGMFVEDLKKAAPDLTEIAKRNGGQFPEEKVSQIIRDGRISGHGTMRLLSWEKYFRMANSDAQADQIVRDLTKYLKKHQTQ